MYLQLFICFGDKETSLLPRKDGKPGPPGMHFSFDQDNPPRRADEIVQWFSNRWPQCVLILVILT